MLLYDRRFLASMAVTAICAIGLLVIEVKERVEKKAACSARHEVLAAAGALPEHPSGFL